MLVDVWQKNTKFCKVITLQLKKINKLTKNKQTNKQTNKQKNPQSVLFETFVSWNENTCWFSD